jgi:hypothetical protein
MLEETRLSLRVVGDNLEQWSRAYKLLLTQGVKQSHC